MTLKRIAWFFSLGFAIFVPLTNAFAQQFQSPPANKAIVVYSLETEDKKLRHYLAWAQFDPGTGLYIGTNFKDGDKYKSEMNRFRGEEIFEAKRDGKKYKRTYFEIIDPGTYVLHSVFSKDSLTSYHPLTFGFTAKAGDVLFIGSFSVNQRGDSFRSNIDPNTGVTLDFRGTDLNLLEMDTQELEKYNLMGIRDVIASSPPVYFEVREYQ